MTIPEQVCKYLRIDDPGESEQIGDLVEAAETYLTNAGVTKQETNQQYILAVSLLVSNWYDNRSGVLVGSISKSLEFSLQSIITQLKYCIPPVVEVSV